MTVQKNVPRFCTRSICLWLKPVSATGVSHGTGVATAGGLQPQIAPSQKREDFPMDGYIWDVASINQIDKGLLESATFHLLYHILSSFVAIS